MAYLHMGVYFASHGQTEAAIKLYKDLIKTRPDYMEARLNLGNLLLMQGQVNAAIQQLQAALQLNPNNAGVYNNLGVP